MQVYNSLPPLEKEFFPSRLGRKFSCPLEAALDRINENDLQERNFLTSRAEPQGVLLPVRPAKVHPP
jgi:hypothetical protein